MNIVEGIPRIILISLILVYANSTYLSSSRYISSLPDYSVKLVGDLTFRFYPDGSIGVKIRAEGNRSSIDGLDRLRFSIRSEAEDSCYRCMIDALLVFARDFTPSINHTLDLECRFEGGRDELRFLLSIDLLRGDGLNITTRGVGRYVKITRFFEIHFDTTVSLTYTFIGLDRAMVEGLIRIIPTMMNLYEAIVSISSERMLSLKTQLKDYGIGSEVCILYLSSEISGSLKGLRKFLESNLDIPILDVVLKGLRYPILKNTLDLYFYAIDKASELRCAWINTGWIHCRSSNGVTSISGYFEFYGDMDRCITEILWLISWIRGSVRYYGILTDILGYPTKISIRSLEADFKLEEGYLSMYVSGAKLTDLDPYNLLRILSAYSFITPMDGVTLTLEGSSNYTMMVELAVPDVSDGMSKPIRVDGRHRIVWVFRNLGSIDRVELRIVENPFGISDLTYYEYRYQDMGYLHVLKIYTNSTLLSDPVVRTGSISLTIRGGGRFSEASNISIPCDLVDGILVCLLNGSVYLKPIVSKHPDEYWSYIYYPPSVYSIEIVWGRPEFKLEADSQNVAIGNEVVLKGILRIHGVGLSRENVTLIVDGEPIADITVREDGSFSYRFKPARIGVAYIWARYSSQGLTYETERIRITVSGYNLPSIIVIAVTAATLSLATIFILHKRGYLSIPFLKNL